MPRCTAVTKKGVQCTRQAKGDISLCLTHFHAQEDVHSTTSEPISAVEGGESASPLALGEATDAVVEHVPVSDAPASDAPVSDTPAVDAPAVDAPASDSSEVEEPEVLVELTVSDLSESGTGILEDFPPTIPDPYESFKPIHSTRVQEAAQEALPAVIARSEEFPSSVQDPYESFTRPSLSFNLLGEFPPPIRYDSFLYKRTRTFHDSPIQRNEIEYKAPSPAIPSFVKGALAGVGIGILLTLACFRFFR